MFNFTNKLAVFKKQKNNDKFVKKNFLVREKLKKNNTYVSFNKCTKNSF